MGFLLNGQPLSADRAFTDAQGTQYPSNWLRLATDEEKEAVGITWEDDPAPIDYRFYWSAGNPKALEDEPTVDADTGEAVLDADGNQIITKGLKTLWKEEQKQQANSALAATDWYVTRKAETDVAIPAAVSTYRTAVRTVSGTREGQLDACATLDEFIALVTNPEEVYDADTDTWSANTEPFLTPWPEAL